MAENDTKNRVASCSQLQVSDVECSASGVEQDKVDTDLASYVNSFIESLPDSAKLEKFSIATREDAKAALVALDQTMQRLTQQLSTARALQQLVLSNRRE